MNRYLYAEANPWTFTDPSGHGVYCAATADLCDETLAIKHQNTQGGKDAADRITKSDLDYVTHHAKPPSRSYDGNLQATTETAAPSAGTPVTVPLIGTIIYVVSDENDLIRYVGRTINYAQRVASYGGRWTSQGLQMKPVTPDIDPAAARWVEQYGIDTSGGAQSTGGTLQNKINGISPRNLDRPTYRAAGTPWLEENGSPFARYKNGVGGGSGSDVDNGGGGGFVSDVGGDSGGGGGGFEGGFGGGGGEELKK